MPAWSPPSRMRPRCPTRRSSVNGQRCVSGWMPAGRACTSSGGWPRRRASGRETGKTPKRFIEARAGAGAGAGGLQPGCVEPLARRFLDASRTAAEQTEQKKEAARQRELEQAHKLVEAERLRAEDQARFLRQVEDALARAERQTRRAQAGEPSSDAQVAATNNKRDPSQSLLLARDVIRAQRRSRWLHRVQRSQGCAGRGASRAALASDLAAETPHGQCLVGGLQPGRGAHRHRQCRPDRRGCGTPRAATNCCNWPAIRPRSGRRRSTPHGPHHRHRQ